VVQPAWVDELKPAQGNPVDRARHPLALAREGATGEAQPIPRYTDLRNRLRKFLRRSPTRRAARAETVYGFDSPCSLIAVGANTTNESSPGPAGDGEARMKSTSFCQQQSLLCCA